MTMLGRWDQWWQEKGADPLGGGGEGGAYQRGAAWLRDCNLVEDWGCGAQRFREYLHPDQQGYLGVDGSGTPNIVADLTEYRSEVPGIFMRHVLEHNDQWRLVMSNLCKSFTARAAVVLFTPLAERTEQIGFDTVPGVPVLSFALDDLMEVMFNQPLNEQPRVRLVGVEAFASPGTAYNAETILRLAR